MHSLFIQAMLSWWFSDSFVSYFRGFVSNKECYSCAEILCTHHLDLMKDLADNNFYVNILNL